ncbi:DUF4430 domain-containing protein [Lignipirellula cremea]|uniref:Transcobalamin-like C-terminal domain-containing protein n=1 Tax=Lignipirellula cremea TaxID=2528010 RepID=A0A518DPE6_9BACT|nr:DUF4430 domain-containing protein [Lignipirellula cremea]QDU93683.1 hypothetical protein Pla8534_14640 [Lignipirellula cremea]
MIRFVPLILASLLLPLTAQEIAPWLARPAVAAETIHVAFVFDADTTKGYTVVWSDKMTVQSALQLIAKSDQGVPFEHQGSGETAFLTAINGVKNEGVFGANWTYRVNDKAGSVSYAICPLAAGDRVEWRFGKFDPSE